MKNRSRTQNVLRNSLYDFATTMTSRIGGLFFTIILARIFLPELFGLYSLTLSIVFLLVTIIDTAVNSALLKYINLRTKKDKERSIAYFQYLLKMKLIVTIYFSIGLALFAYPLSQFVFTKQTLFIPMLISAIFLLLLSLDGFFSVIFFTLNDVRIVLWKEIISQISRIILIATIPIFIARQHYVSAAIAMLAFVTLLLLLFTSYILKNKYGFFFRKTKVDIDKIETRRFLFYIAIGGLSAMIFSYIDVLMIGVMISDISYVGYYRAATTLVFSIAGMLTFNKVLIPQFSNIKEKNLQSAFNKVMKFSLALSIPAVFGILVIGKYLLRTIYGYSYLPALYPLFFLSFLIIEAVFSGTLYSLLSAKGQVQIYTKATSLTLILNVILNFIFITILIQKSLIFAITGAAIATLISRYVYAGILLTSIKKTMHITLRPNFVIKPIIASIGMAAILFLINFYLIEDMNLIIGALEIIGGILIYTAFMFGIKGFVKEDLQLLNYKNYI